MADNRDEEIKLLCRDHAESAVRTLVSVMEDGLAENSARVKAADTILRRGFGEPERKVSSKVDVTVYDERAAHLTALQKLASKREVNMIEDASYSVIDDGKPKGRNDYGKSHDED